MRRLLPARHLQNLRQRILEHLRIILNSRLLLRKPGLLRDPYESKVPKTTKISFLSSKTVPYKRVAAPTHLLTSLRYRQNGPTSEMNDSALPSSAITAGGGGAFPSPLTSSLPSSFLAWSLMRSRFQP